MNPVHVTLACDSKLEYLFYAPIAALFWKEVIGYNVILGFVVDPRRTDHPCCKLVSDTVRAWCPDSKVIDFPNQTRLPDRSLAQLIRLFFPLRYPDIFSLTSDIDMLPLNRDYFSVANEEQLHYFDCGNWANQIAICYVGAKGKLWEDILGVSYSGITAFFLEDLFRKYNPTGSWASLRRRKKGSDAWYTDQRYLTEKLRTSDAYRTDLYKPRAREQSEILTWRVADRIDRAGWDFDPNRKGFYVDAHAPLRKPWDRRQTAWRVTSRLLETYLPEKKAVIEVYADEFSAMIRSASFMCKAWQRSKSGLTRAS